MFIFLFIFYSFIYFVVLPLDYSVRAVTDIVSTQRAEYESFIFPLYQYVKERYHF